MPDSEEKIMIKLIIGAFVSGVCWVVFHAHKWPFEGLFALVAIVLTIIILYKGGAFESNPPYSPGNVCPRCHGRGRISNVDMGLGQHGMIPAYSEVSCPVCHGSGRVAYVQYTDQDSEDEGRVMTCPRCYGKGTIIDISIGLGPHGPVPAYREIPCPECGGSGQMET